MEILEYIDLVMKRLEYLSTLPTSPSTASLIYQNELMLIALERAARGLSFRLIKLPEPPVEKMAVNRELMYHYGMAQAG